MKLGVSMYSYVKAVKDGRMDIVSFIHEAKRIGADGVELLDFFYSDVESQREKAKDALAETGLVCGVFSVANNFAKANQSERDDALQNIRFGVDEAVQFGASVVRVFAGDLVADSGIGYDEAVGWIIEGLVESANYANQRSVYLALENHGKLAGKSSQIVEIISAVRNRCGHAALGANPDTGNFMLVGESGVDGVKGVAPLAYMVHFKDFSPTVGGHYIALDGTEFAGTVIGEGTVDLAACLDALRDVGFAGWVNLEYEGETDPMLGVPASMDNARRFVYGD